MAKNDSKSPIRFREAIPDDRDTVTRLWQACGLTRPWNDPAADFDAALAGPSSTVLVGHGPHGLMASIMVGHDGHRGCVYYVSVSTAHRHEGVGRALMVEAEAWLRARGLAKLNLLVRGDNRHAIGFYEALGYSVEPNVQLSRRLDADEA